MIEPHGGQLVQRILTPEHHQQFLAQAATFHHITLTPRQLSDLFMIAQGGFSPLEGFMNRSDYHGVVQDMRLSNGIVWPLPVTLSVSLTTAQSLEEGKDVGLLASDGTLQGIMRIDEIFSYVKAEEARQVFGTQDEAHPGVSTLFHQGDVFIGGPIWMVGPSPQPFPGHCLSPAETRALFLAKKWEKVVGFQTRNPIHRAHEYIQKCALETMDGLLVHPLVGETKSDDIPAEVRMRCYQVLLERYFPINRVVLSVFPAFMRYAGPREAIFHALVRKNYGCSHFIVGRDHAGVGNYYGPYDAQDIFTNFTSDELEITPMFFENSFFCHLCLGMATNKTCPHGEDSHVSLSGTQVREILHTGALPPPEFTRPEVAQVLVDAQAMK